MSYAHLCWALAYHKAADPATFWAAHTASGVTSGSPSTPPWVNWQPRVPPPG